MPVWLHAVAETRVRARPHGCARLLHTRHMQRPRCARCTHRHCLTVNTADAGLLPTRFCSRQSYVLVSAGLPAAKLSVCACTAACCWCCASSSSSPTTARTVWRVVHAHGVATAVQQAGAWACQLRGVTPRPLPGPVGAAWWCSGCPAGSMRRCMRGCCLPAAPAHSQPLFAALQLPQRAVAANRGDHAAGAHRRPTAPASLPHGALFLVWCGTRPRWGAHAPAAGKAIATVPSRFTARQGTTKRNPNPPGRIIIPSF
jgi:hypothetical protein